MRVSMLYILFECTCPRSAWLGSLLLDESLTLKDMKQSCSLAPYSSSDHLCKMIWHSYQVN